MDIADADLNLLVVFDALLRARSVSGAARDVHFTRTQRRLDQRRAIGAGLAKLADIKLVKPPFKAKPRIIQQHWHARFQHDAANRWLRSVVAELFMDKETRPRPRTRR